MKFYRRKRREVKNRGYTGTVRTTTRQPRVNRTRIHINERKSLYSTVKIRNGSGRATTTEALQRTLRMRAAMIAGGPVVRWGEAAAASVTGATFN